MKSPYDEIIIVFGGPSGSGKTTLANLISNNRVITTTTRPMRKGERNGVDYYFVSKEQFEELIRTNQLVEWNEYEDKRKYKTLLWFN